MNNKEIQFNYMNKLGIPFKPSVTVEDQRGVAESRPRQ